MARFTGNVCRLCRREGFKLFLKGRRCESEKCAIERHNVPPGMNLRSRPRRLSDYGVHLREKQKAKRIFGVMERQFRRYFKMAERMRGNTGQQLISLLERRLDNVLDASGLSLSRPHGRQIIAHGHVTVNGRRMDIPSYLVRPGDVIACRDRDSSRKIIGDCLELNSDQSVPTWLEADATAKAVKVLRTPTREDFRFQHIQEQFIVELCSK